MKTNTQTQRQSQGHKVNDNDQVTSVVILSKSKWLIARLIFICYSWIFLHMQWSPRVTRLATNFKAFPYGTTIQRHKEISIFVNFIFSMLQFETSSQPGPFEPLDSWPTINLSLRQESIRYHSLVKILLSLSTCTKDLLNVPTCNGRSQPMNMTFYLIGCLKRIAPDSTNIPLIRLIDFCVHPLALSRSPRRVINFICESP